MLFFRVTAAALMVLATVIPVNFASAQGVSGKIGLELNHIQPNQAGGCRLSVIATNGLERPIDKLGLELVVFNKDGIIDRLMRLDLRRMSAGKTKVQQFDLTDVPCEGLSRLHINDVLNCVPPAITGVYCPDLLELSNRTNVQFGD
ncbi:hypothetical protein [Labrenzia sp. PHM005]|uniref:hypothetical protein n=1 Tax=Labrenzia sp. PHM005 TaxID=2590016 RepID=UPI001140907A|nr:hypothetical protein [Labrenzia sp. PHM005]QDG77475.1 hypothetical protein FJ695_17250 [Labrenzia sp. PHM005]